jgi:hypothetical protein
MAKLVADIIETLRVQASSIVTAWWATRKRSAEEIPHVTAPVHWRLRFSLRSRRKAEISDLIYSAAWRIGESSWTISPTTS